MEAPTVSSSLPIRSHFSWLDDHRYRWLLASTVALCVFTALAFVQAPDPDPYKTPRWTDGDYWRYPVEQNASKRLPLLRGITAIATASPSQRLLVAVGNQLLFSVDGGAHWQIADVDWTEVPATTQRADALLPPALFASAWAGEMPAKQQAYEPVQQQQQQQQQQQYPRESLPVEQYNKFTPSKNLSADVPVEPPAVNADVIRKKSALTPTKNNIAPTFNKAPTAPDKTTQAPDKTPEPVLIAQRADPQLQPLIALQWLAADRAFALGADGALLASVDGGEHWRLRGTVPARAPLSALSFIDTEQGWAADSGGNLYVSRDGGAHWQPNGALWMVRQRQGDSGSRAATANDAAAVVPNAIRQLQAVDANTVWLLAGDGTLMRNEGGGNRWQPLDVRFAVSAFQLFDANRGWLLASDGRLLSTLDAGRNWAVLASAPKLRHFRFFDADHGWGISASGVLYYSADGGGSWQRWRQEREAPNNRAVAAFGLLPLSAERLLLNGGDQLSITTRADPRRLPLTRPVFGLVDKIDGVGACQASGTGALLCSADGPHWRWYPLATDSAVTAFKFVDARTGWIGTREGRLFSTRDGGREWQPVRQAPAAAVTAMAFADAQRGWLTTTGLVYSTRDAGDSWQPADQHCSGCYTQVEFADPQLGWLLGVDHFARTADGGKSWQSATLPSGGKLRGAAFIDASTGWLVGDEGRLLATADGGLSWTAQSSGVTSALNDIAFLDPQTGWAVGDGGVVLSTKNGGRSWKALKNLSADTLQTITFRDPTHAVICGRGGPALYTENGGADWLPVLYRRQPPRWYYLSLGAALALLLPALRRPDPQRRVAESIANLLASDAPLQPGDPDPLGFALIARTLSAFIRNRNTSPPLTIAICGRWGSGKSSLMNLLRSDLKRYGFPGVWFNAWHHQKEEHLLASLLSSIRRQGVPKLLQLRPPFINPDWVSFRYGLLVQRGPNYWLMALFFLFLAALSAAFVADNPSTVDQRLAQLMRLLPWSDQSQTPGSGAAETRPWVVLWQSRDLFGLATSLSLVGAGIFKVLRAFGVSPGRLLQESGPNQGSKELDSKLDFRHYFGREFREVTAALHPQRMVIFIDDLDRCRHEHVLEVLEAINFLVSSGDCIVVLGMDYQVVQQSVMLEYRELAEQLAKSADNGGRSAERFAEEYLEKLINVQIPVPELEPGESAHLLVAEPSDPTPWQDLCAQLRALGRMLLPLLLVLAALLLGVFGGEFLVENTRPATAVLTAVNTTGANTAATSTAAINAAAAPATTVPAAQPATATVMQPNPALFVDEAKVLPDWQRYLLLPLTLLGIALTVVVLRRRDVITDDSDTFREALQIWSGVVQLHRNTPRAVKRFLNRARYMAMRVRQQQEPESAGWKRWVRRATPEAPDILLEEQSLVAISALYHVDPAWLHNPANVDHLPPVAAEAIARHRNLFGSWPPPPQQLKQFQQLLRGIRV